MGPRAAASFCCCPCRPGATDTTTSYNHSRSPQPPLSPSVTQAGPVTATTPSTPILASSLGCRAREQEGHQYGGGL